MMSLGPAALAVLFALPQSFSLSDTPHGIEGGAQIIRVAAEEETASGLPDLPLNETDAVALGDGSEPETNGNEQAGGPDGVTAGPEAVKPAQCETPEEMLLMVAREREKITAQKAEAEAKIAEAALASEAVTAEIARLEALKSEIESFANARNEEQKKELARLVKVYETMAPKDAAALLGELDMGTTMELFGLMKERKAAEIMAKMDPVRARAISRILVEMAKLPGDRDLTGIRIK